MNTGSLRQFGGYLRTRWASPRRIRFWLLVLIILYTLLGFFGVPWVVRYVAVNTALEDFGRELRIEAVHANPYMLTLRINGLELNDTDNQQLLGWNGLFIDLAWASIVNRTWTFQTIHFDQPIIQEERFDSGESRLSRLAAEHFNKAPSEDSPEPLPALRVDELHLDGGVLRFADYLQDAAAGEPNQVSLVLQDIELSAEAFSLHQDAQFPLHLEGQLAHGGRLRFDGALQRLPNYALTGSTRVDELALIQIEPYLRQFVNVRLDSGTLSLTGQMHKDALQPFAFQGAASIEALNIRDGSNDEPLIGWQRIQTEQLELSFAEKQLEAGPVAIDGLSGQIVIYEDRTTNFAHLMATPRADAKDDDDQTGTDDNTSEKPTPFDITIAGIELTDGTFQFADHSLPLLFSTRIHALSGQVSTVSSTSDAPAEVELEGQIEEYGLVRVEGTIHAWNLTRETNIQLSFRNLQIPEYSPYTVRLAGRKIAEGTMDLDLGYTFIDKQFNGSNNLVFHNLKLGEKMATSNAMDLPLDLVIALLEDGNGVIDLDFPVTGDVGDPEFNFFQTLRQALVNAIASIVQSPSNFLANLFGADAESLGKIEFPEGRADLLPPQRARIDTLREALNQRPALVLELAGPYNRSFDGTGLQRQIAIEALRQSLAEAGRNVADPSLTAEANQDIIETMFSTYYPDIDPEDVQTRFIKTQNDSSTETSFDDLAYRNYLAERIIAAQFVSETDFIAIANARAIAVRDALAESTAGSPTANDRVRIQDPKEIEAVEGEHIVMEIGITVDEDD